MLTMVLLSLAEAKTAVMDEIEKKELELEMLKGAKEAIEDEMQKIEAVLEEPTPEKCRACPVRHICANSRA